MCLCLEVGLDTVEAAARLGHDAGATVLLNLSPYAEIPASLAALCDILLVNAHEASLFLGGAAVPDAGADAAAWAPVRDKFADRGLHRVVVTLGANSFVVLDSGAGAEGRITRIEPTRVNAKDTTGAGDAFTGAVAARLAPAIHFRPLPPSRPLPRPWQRQEGDANGVPESGGCGGTARLTATPAS